MDKKQIARFLIQEVVVDQSREKGEVWFRIFWQMQTGATSEHSFIRRVLGYADYIFPYRLNKGSGICTVKKKLMVTLRIL